MHCTPDEAEARLSSAGLSEIIAFQRIEEEDRRREDAERTLDAPPAAAPAKGFKR